MSNPIVVVEATRSSLFAGKPNPISFSSYSSTLFNDDDYDAKKNFSA
jgi:hypothetical protein